MMLLLSWTFRLVVPAPRLAWKREAIFPAAVFDLEEALGNVDIGSAIFAHRPKFQEMGLGTDIAHRVDQVECPHDVVGLCEDCMIDVNHAVRRRRHLGEMHDRVGLEGAEHVPNELIIGQIAAREMDILLQHLAKGMQALRHPRDRGGRLGPYFGHPVASRVVVAPTDDMPSFGQVLRQRPTQIPVNACN